jgi:hypothetical protein
MKSMHLKEIACFIILAALLTGISGVVSAATTTQMDMIYFTDPDFLSPSWKPTPITTSYSDPDFLSPNWKPTPVTTSYSDPDFLSPSWKPAPITTSYTDPSFLSPGWKVPELVPFADPGFLSNSWKVPDLTPFADKDFYSSNWTVPNLYRNTTYHRVYIYNPGSAEPFTVPDASQYQYLPEYDPFAPPGPEWTDSGYLFGP